MWNWLKNLFGGAPRARKTIDLEAHLASVDGGLLHGDAEYEEYDDGSWSFEAELEHAGPAPAGPIEVFIDGVKIADLAPRDDESEVKLRSGVDALAKTPTLGAAVEIRAGGAAVVKGVFQADR